MAKSYILYRERHKGIREAKQTGLNLERLIKDYISDADWKIRENSNEGDDELLRAQRPGLRRGPVELRPQPDLHRADQEGPSGGRLPHPRPVLSHRRLLRRLVAREPPAQGLRPRPQPGPFHPGQAPRDGRPCTWSTTSGRCRASSPGPRPSRASTPSSPPSSATTSSDYDHVKQDIQKLIFGLNVPSPLGLADALLQPDLRLDHPRGHEEQEGRRRRQGARHRATATTRTRWT